MSQAAVLDLVTQFAFGLEGPAPVAAFYHDLTWDATYGWKVPSVALLVPATADEAVYQLPSLITGFIFGVFYDDILLSQEDITSLQAVNAMWRDERGRPRAVITQEQSEPEIRVYPIPDEDGQDFIFLFGSPFGADFPARSIAAIVSDRRDNLPEWLDLPMALSVLGKEYERDSAHRDALFAQQCRQMAETMLAWVVPGETG